MGNERTLRLMTDSEPIMLLTHRTVLLLAFGLLLPARYAHGDAVVTVRAMTASTIAEVFIHEETIRVRFEIGGADLVPFKNLLTDEIHDRLESIEYDAPSMEERRQLFFSRDFVLRADDGPPLDGKINSFEVRKRIARDEVTGEPLATQPKHAGLVVAVEIRYDLLGRPATITLRRPNGDDSHDRPASVGFVAYHKGLPVNDFRYLPAEVTLDLDWNDPWYSEFRHPNLRRQYDAPLAAFLYVDSFEVRKEIILRPKDLHAWTDVELGSAPVIAIERQEEIKQRVAEFLRDKNRLTIDGQEVEGRLDRIHFVRRSLRTTGIVNPPVDLGATSATLGVIFVYPVAKLPKQVTMTWDLFSPRIQAVPAIATDEAGGLPATLTPEDPVLVWKNYLRRPTVLSPVPIASPSHSLSVSIPTISAGCLIVGMTVLISCCRYSRTEQGARLPMLLLGTFALAVGAMTFPYARVSVPNPLARAASLTDDDARQLLQGLIFNVYRAFDHHDESLIYDSLQRSIAGDLVAQVYLDTRKSMEIKNQGGLRISVKQVDVDEVLRRGASGDTLTFDCQWRVVGSIGHWGHLHRRANQHRARLTIARVEDAWKLTGLEMVDEQPIVDATAAGDSATRGNP